MEVTRIADQSMTASAPEASKVADSAKEFEAILIAQMLKSARESGGGSWLSSDEDRASSPALEFAEQQLAKSMAETGGLGIARLLTRQLQDHKEE